MNRKNSSSTASIPSKARGVVFKIDRVQWSDSKGEYHCQYAYTLWYGSSYSKPFVVVVDPEPDIRPGDEVEIDYNPVYNTREHLLVNSIKKLEDKECQKKKRKTKRKSSSK